MRLIASFLLIFSVAFAGVSNSYASDKKARGGRFVTEIREKSSIVEAENDRKKCDTMTIFAQCEPIPVALDLRFMDDDYSLPVYDLPIALDLDWESGEP